MKRCSIIIAGIMALVLVWSCERMTLYDMEKEIELVLSLNLKLDLDIDLDEGYDDEFRI